MSISDQIVVMKEGVLHQMGKPQEVYDDPVDLFVATFLGTPPINVFDCRVKDGKLWIGEEAVMDAGNAPEGAVTVAIRPEALVPSLEGSFTCGLNRVEVMGRDICVVLEHSAFIGDAFRAIIDSEDLRYVSGTQVKFSLKRNKVFLFKPESGERIRY